MDAKKPSSLKHPVDGVVSLIREGAWIGCRLFKMPVNIPRRPTDSWLFAYQKKPITGFQQHECAYHRSLYKGSGI